MNPSHPSASLFGVFGPLAEQRAIRKPGAGRLCSLSAKDAQRNSKFALPRLHCDVSKQQVAGLPQRATQMLQLDAG